jgi:hypothetical protein
MCGARSSVRDTEQSGDEVQQPPGLAHGCSERHSAAYDVLECRIVARYVPQSDESCSRARVCPGMCPKAMRAVAVPGCVQTMCNTPDAAHSHCRLGFDMVMDISGRT